MKIIKVEWCENFIRAAFTKHHPFAGPNAGIEVGYFWKLAEKSGLWERGTYGSPMSKLCRRGGMLPKLGKVNAGGDGLALVDAGHGVAVLLELLCDPARRAHVKAVQGADLAAVQHYGLCMYGARLRLPLVDVFHRVSGQVYCLFSFHLLFSSV